jgi:hypothetical protein
VFDTTRDGNTELYVMDADGSNLRRLTNDPAEDWSASWSPRGDKIGFVSGREGVGAIYVVGAAGGDPGRLTDLSSWANGPAWSADGTRIAFETDRNGDQEIWSMAADGTDLRDLSRSPGSSDDVWDGRWAADGRIVFARAGYEPADASGTVRVDFAAALVLLHAMLLALVVLVVLRMAPPFGAFAIILGLATAIAAAPSETWRFIPGAVIGGLAVDLAVRYAPTRYRAIVAGATSAAGFVLAMGVTALLTNGLSWSMTILLGVTCFAAAFGAGLAMIVPLIGAGPPAGRRAGSEGQ